MPAKTDDLHQGLQCEDGGEDDVDHVKRIGKGFALMVMFHSHGTHVEQDQENDGQFEFSAHRNVEEEALDFLLP